MRRHSRGPAAVAAGGFAVAAMSVFVFWPATQSSAQIPSADATVTLQNIQYNPSKVSLTGPGTVQFVHKDGQTPHTITGAYEGQTKPESQFESHPQCQPSGDPADCFQEGDGPVFVSFKTPGKFLYHCRIHPSMTGEIDIAGTVPTVTSTTKVGATTTTKATTATTVGTLTTTSSTEATTTSSTALSTTSSSIDFTTQTTIGGTAAGSESDDDEPSGVLEAVGVLLLAAVVAALIPAWRRLT